MDPRAAETLARYCPHVPTDKQRAFLGAPHLEVFFGGAAGGGKSVALLMAALQYVHVPGYAALILRKDTQRLALAGGLIPKSHEWLSANSAAAWNAARRQWTLNTGAAPATIAFGYLSTPSDKFRYASSEFQLIGFDELTELPEADYLFLFSRLRQAGTVGVPLRMRSASNPGNLGHTWVKQRFVEQGPVARSQWPAPNSPGCWHLTPGSTRHDRLFIPSRLSDNPHLDGLAYRRSLVHLPPVERERLLSGDWSVQERGLIHADWLRYYTLTRSVSEGDPQSPDHWSGCSASSLSMSAERSKAPTAVVASPRPMVGALNLLAPDGRLLSVVDPASCRRFITVDPAGTSAERAAELRGQARSFTVAQVWEQPRGQSSHFLILRHQVRGHFSFHDIVAALRQLADQWEPDRIWIENERLGVAIRDALHDLPVSTIPTRGRDKAVRATRLLNKLQAGEVFLPRHENSWLHDFEKELLAWTGDNREMTDQIDAAAYAAIIADTAAPGILKLEPIISR